MKPKVNKRVALASVTFLPALIFAQEQQAQGTTAFSNALFNTLLGIIIFLLIVIVALSQVMKNIAQSDYLLKKNKGQDNNGAKALGIIILSTLALSAQAGTGDNSWKVGGLEPFTFYFMLGVIILEIIFLASILVTLNQLLRSEKTAPETVIAKPKEKTILEKLNASVEVEREEEIMLTHNYDGIRELDNDLPPWWKYGFYLTVVVAVVYLIHYHIAGTGDLQLAEYNKEVEKARIEIAEYMKNAAGNVDETTVKIMEGADVAAGRQLFVSTCAACHGKLGEGGVGPNLTDAYWLHGGGISDIFKSIKYGWADKGMKSWKEDLSPVQIAQVSSFIKTLYGTNPPNGKAPQGEMYKDVQQSDSLSTGTDSTKVQLSVDSLNKLAEKH